MGGSGSNRQTRRARRQARKGGSQGPEERRSLPPRPPEAGAVGEAGPSRSGARQASPPVPTHRETAAERFLVREAQYLGGELQRVIGVTAVCLALLVGLVVVDRVG